MVSAACISAAPQVLRHRSFAQAVYGNRSLPGQSDFNPFRPDFESFPLARGVSPRTVVLGAGDSLVVPAGWCVASTTGRLLCIPVSRLLLLVMMHDGC